MIQFYPKAQATTSGKRNNMFYKPGFTGKLLHVLFIVTILLCFTPRESKAQENTWSKTYWQVKDFDVNKGTVTVKVLLRVYDTGKPLRFISNATMSYDLDGLGHYRDFAKISRTTNAHDITIIDELTNATQDDPIRLTGEDQYWLTLTINITDQTKNIKHIQIIGDWMTEPKPYPTVFGFSEIENISIPIMSKFDLAPVSFITKGKPDFNNEEVRRVLIGFKKHKVEGMEKNATVQLFWQETSTNIIPFTSQITDVSTNFIYDTIYPSTQQQRYFFKEGVYFDFPSKYPYGRITMNSPIVTIPSFPLPSGISANYNSSDHNLTFSWKVSPVDSGSYVETPFKLQLSTDSSFDDIVVEKTIPYNNSNTSFRYTTTPTQNLSPHMYFRVSREYNNPDWKMWDVAQKSEIVIPFVSLSKDSTSATLQEDKTALVKWDANGYAWLPGSSLILTRLNYTTGLQSDITLSETDFKKGFYIDKLISTCNEYHYTLQVKPSTGSLFTAYPAVEVKSSVLNPDIGKLMSITASKGYFPGRTQLNWQSTGAFDNFIIKRATYGTDNYVQIATLPGTTDGNFEFNDEKGIPGVYYSYSITGMIKCNQKSVFSKEILQAIGFRSPTGNIHGRVVYKNGQAVSGAGIRLQSKDALQFGKSIYLNGSETSYLSVDSISHISDTTTIEAWIKPDNAAPSNQVIISRPGQFELGFNAAGNLYFNANGAIAEAGYKNDNQTYIHVAGVRTPDSVKIVVNGIAVGQKMAPIIPGTPSVNLLIGGNQNGNYFKGFLDELIIWNTALGDSVIALNYNRIITGGEKFLAAYWRFDESIKDQFYDQAHEGINYHKNDGFINSGAWHTDTIPSAGQLSFKAYTDSTGNYMISGIPYTGNGTIYQVVPTFSTHQFDPVSDSRFISENTADFTLNFTDKSSFPVSGRVYYANTTVPVPGVNFFIDGQYAQNSDGSLMQTDESGKFNITVPVGIHRVQATKSNHVFTGKGEILDNNGNYFDFQDAMAGLKLTDSTTIRFTGRVIGGAIQAALPLGYSLSRNNLGKDLAITLYLSGGASNISLNESTAIPTREVVPHHQHSGFGDTGQVHETTVDYYKDKIVIHPDALTGEFAANIIPQKFYTDNVTATHWGNILSDKVQFDFTNKFVNFNTSYHFKDSTYKDDSRPDSGYIYQDYIDSLSYNDSAIFIKRVAPTLAIVQTETNGTPLPYFGDTTYEYNLVNGTNITSKIIDLTRAGKDIYLLGHPVFSQNMQYNFKISSFESYPYYETAQGSPLRTEIFPVTDGKININNEMKAGVTGTQVLPLNATGEVDYNFYAGEPDLSDALKNFTATLQVGKASPIPWPGEGKDGMKAFNTGNKSTGTNFVTQGPDRIMMILRDPPGSRSYSYAEKNTTFHKTNSWSTQISQEGEAKVTASLGPKLATWIGIGAGTVVEFETIFDLSLNLKHEEHWTSSHGTSETNTITDRFQTSEDRAFVGEAGDVFIGNSTNITYGTGSTILIINKQKDIVQPDDLVYFNTDNYAVVKRTSLQIGQQFGTLFAFTQQHIENKAIPHLKDFIKNVLSKYPLNYSAAAAQQAADDSRMPVYISHLSLDNKWFGKWNHDPVFGTGAHKPYYDGDSYSIYYPQNTLTQNDTIMTLNQYINQWVEQLRKNEEGKVNSTLAQNYSFHAGSPIEHSEELTRGTDTSHSFNFLISGSIGGKLGLSVNKVGIEYELHEGVGGGDTVDSTQSHDTTNTLGFVLASDGADDYFSVDIKRANDNSGFVFITRGGESACPYEGGSVTKYFDSGRQLNYPTVQIEVPKFDVDKHELNNVPSSRPAVFNLTLRNESEAKSDATYMLGYVDNNSIKGATIEVDGVSIGGAGRPIMVRYGEEVQKVLTITRGPNELNYDSIMILWHSSCQYDPTSYIKPIGDTQVISAHFIPSCTDINISTPAPNWILNTKSPIDTTGIRFLPVNIDKFDLTNALFDHIVLQYKPSSSDKWQPAATFYADSTTWKAATGSDKYVITDPAAIHYNFDMNNTFFPDQGYDIQAVSTCITGLSTVVTLSNIISGIKDTITPRQFGNTQPANGVLGASDEIKLTFNEPIEGGLLTDNNFQVTGIKNLTQGNHSVSVVLDGENDYLSTEFAKNFTGKSITAEMWVRATGTNGGTVFSQGNSTTSMELALTSDKHLQVTIGDKTLKSDLLNYSQDWAHVALVYNDVTKKISAFYNFIEVIKGADVEAYTGTGNIEFGRSVKSHGNFFKGGIHEARIWSKALSFADLQVNSLTSYSGGESGLLAYYPMNEGKGKIAFDKANGSNATLTGNWTTPPGKAVVFNNKGFLRLNSSSATISSTMNYTIELWFKGEGGQKDAALASNGKGDGNEINGSGNLFFLGFEDGLLTYQNSGFKIQANANYLDNNWHHVAVSVDHNAGSVRLFVDGELKNHVEAANPGGIAPPYIYLGVRAWEDTDSITVHFDRYFKGSVDEFRLWDTYLSQTLINKNNNVQLKTDEFGLKLYYPFETFRTSNSGIITLDSTWKDMAANGSNSYAYSENASPTEVTAPLKSQGPVSNLNFNYVVNNDALIINLLEQKSAIDKTMVTVSVREAFDKKGNQMASPVTWTAYINQNPLQWSEDELNLSKEANKPMQFVSYVINNGGSNQKFTITNLPKWMSTDVVSGELAPLGKLKITFTINERINNGAYNEVIYLRNNDNQADGLSINLNVKGKQPAWSVDPGAYKYNMAVYGKIRINDVFSADNQDILAVFDNGKCVGVSNNNYNAANDLWYTFLTIFSNKVSHDSLEFRIWEAATGKTYLATPAQPIHFSNDAITGSPSNPVIFEAKEMLYQDIDLKKGWNWISYNVKSPAFNEVNASLINGKWSSGDIVKNNDFGFNEYSSATGWLGYLPGFTNVDMYMLSTANEQTLSVLGMPVDVAHTPISLKGAQWSYISYLPGIKLTVKQALAGYSPTEGDVIKSQTGFAMYDSRNGWIGSLSYLEPGKGYMFYRSNVAGTSFYYPVNVDPLSELRLAGDNNTDINQKTVPDYLNYASNLTMIAVLSDPYELLPGDVVVANSLNGVRGQAKIKMNDVTGKEALFFNIAGDTEEPLFFTLERKGKIVSTSGILLFYHADSRVGSLEKPFIIQMNKNEIRINAYPNPFSNNLTINVEATVTEVNSTHEIQISIHNSNGVLIVKKEKDLMRNGHYQTQWNGSGSSGQFCAPGIYFLNVIIDGKLKSYKIIKN